MTREIRWRILVLQLIATLVLATVAGMAFWAHNFTHDQVSSQLKQQAIVFPVANSPAIKALPAADASAMKQYAGQTMTTGDQAKVWANNFIAVHLKEIGQGKTYAYWSGLSLAHPANAKYAAITQTLFRGETLRSLLLNAWAFWFVGGIALYAAIALSIGAVAVFLAFLFELLVAPRREGVVRLRGRKQLAVPLT
jgi:hypothetical protein